MNSDMAKQLLNCKRAIMSFDRVKSVKSKGKFPYVEKIRATE